MQDNSTEQVLPTHVSAATSTTYHVLYKTTPQSKIEKDNQEGKLCQIYATLKDLIPYWHAQEYHSVKGDINEEQKNVKNLLHQEYSFAPKKKTPEFI